MKSILEINHRKIQYSLAYLSETLSKEEFQRAKDLGRLIEEERQRLKKKFPDQKITVGVNLSGVIYKNYFDEALWEDILLRDDSQNEIIKKFYDVEEPTQITRLSILFFAMKLVPTRIDGLYWMHNYFQCAVGSDIHQEAIKDHYIKQEENRVAQEKYVRSKGGKATAEKHKMTKEEAKEWWDYWVSSPELYPNQTAYIQAMVDKFGISERSVYNWIKAWKAESA